jgi:hypothetical protein
MNSTITLSKKCKPIFSLLKILGLSSIVVTLFLACNNPAKTEETSATTDSSMVKLDSDQVANIVKRSYQYVALYNVINKFAMDESGPFSSKGWNKIYKATSLANADTRSIARPNNDTYYEIANLDLHNDAVVLEIPAFDSKFVSLETSAYDHYVGIPLSTTKGDYKKPVKVLFYTSRTKGYKAGEKIAGIDKYLEMSGDFVTAFHRLMPESNNPVKHAIILKQINELNAVTLSQFLKKPATDSSMAQFPAYGTTDADIFGGNLLEVMQFVFNHSTFDPADSLDNAVLAAYKPLGIEPGKEFDASKAVKIDTALFRKVSLEVKAANIGIMGDQKLAMQLLFQAFQPKGHIDLQTLVFQSVIGPIGQPATEALYPPVNTADGKPMNAMNDYVVRMTKAELPPAKAFWSLTLYDTKNGFFIPNKENKYSVGENAGYKLDKEGGIAIYVSSEKPAGVPAENWLPTNKIDQGLSLMLRIYAPDLSKVKTWKAPKAELINKK